MSEITTSVHDCMCVRLYTSEMNNSVSYIYLPRNAVSFASMKIFTGKASCRHTHDYHMHMEHYIEKQQTLGGVRMDALKSCCACARL